ncbi:MAG: NAD(P)/FAD-dependent oxidoreductase [Roseateles sp.]|uniref:NAD(P)/FAD-dependent oxidoreductase n=1 Tax=Roseateles sp. TaxID=1971397 RepID=UPI0039E982BD
MKYDAIVIGGGFAGLSAALYLARARRQVCVIDAGSPRNRFTDASHGFLGQDGRNPRDLIADARRQVEAYPTVRFIQGSADIARGSKDDFTVTLDTGGVLSSRRLVLAFGLTDLLPDLPGLAERWGKTVLACPYCHGYEFADRKLGVLHMGPMSAMQAALIADWGPVTLYLNGDNRPDDDMSALLSSRDVRIEPSQVVGLDGTGTDLSAVLLADGRRISIDALYVAPPSRLNTTIAEQLGCAIETGRYGPIITVNESKMTTVEGVYAAGDIARANNALIPAADGAAAGIALHAGLVFG